MYADKKRFAPQDVPNPSTVNGLCELFDKFKIPSAFVAESLQGVSQSFSAQKDAEATYVFFHLLVKDVAILDGRIVEGLKQVVNGQRQSQANFTWLKPGFVLRIRNEANLLHPPSGTTTLSNESMLTSTAAQPMVEMFCFGAPVTVRDRFQKLKDTATGKDLLLDPYVLLEIVLGEMYKVMDQKAWAIADIFGKIEKVSIIEVVSCWNRP
jgi:hypothetical protein